MELKDYFSIVISFLALTVSGITAYRTLFARFKPEIYVRPRIFLSRVNKFPCLVASCEMSNQGARIGSIDDVILRVKYRQQNPAQTTKSISTYTFLPTLIGEKYNIFNGEQESDFEPFQSIALSANARLTRFIVFSPSNEDGFVPDSGEMELEFL